MTKIKLTELPHCSLKLDEEDFVRRLSKILSLATKGEYSLHVGSIIKYKFSFFIVLATSRGCSEMELSVSGISRNQIGSEVIIYDLDILGDRREYILAPHNCGYRSNAGRFKASIPDPFFKSLDIDVVVERVVNSFKDIFNEKIDFIYLPPDMYRNYSKRIERTKYPIAESIRDEITVLGYTRRIIFDKYGNYKYAKSGLLEWIYKGNLSNVSIGLNKDDAERVLDKLKETGVCSVHRMPRLRNGEIFVRDNSNGKSFLTFEGKVNDRAIPYLQRAIDRSEVNRELLDRAGLLTERGFQPYLIVSGLGNVHELGGTPLYAHPGYSNQRLFEGIRIEGGSPHSKTYDYSYLIHFKYNGNYNGVLRIGSENKILDYEITDCMIKSISEKIPFEKVNIIVIYDGSYFRKNALKLKNRFGNDVIVIASQTRIPGEVCVTQGDKANTFFNGEKIEYGEANKSL